MRIQIDGVAMGSPLGPLFANFYMGSLEEKIFKDHPGMQPPIYARYVDDVFLCVEDLQQVPQLAQLFNDNSSLNFTYELETDRTLPFLDVLVSTRANKFTTEVYVKKTNLGFCLNGKSECPERFKRSVIRAFVNRAFSHCSSWSSTNAELQRVSSLLVNNGYPQGEIDSIIRQKMDSFAHQQQTTRENTPTIDLYYKSHMNSGYKSDEKALKNIIAHNVIPTNPASKVNLIIFYKSMKTKNLVIKNSCLPPTNTLQEVNVVYEYTCHVGDCEHRTSTYIGKTSTTLSKRLSFHLQNGAIKQHTRDKHNIALNRSMLDANTKILIRENDPLRLSMTEAVLISYKQPTINIQLMATTTLPSNRRLHSRTEGTDNTPATHQ